MNKLKLTLESLAVESFDTTVAAREKGTVFGEQCTCRTQCTCPGCPTCDVSCNGTCHASCDGTCGDTSDCVLETQGDTCQVISCVRECTGYSDCWICM